MSKHVYYAPYNRNKKTRKSNIVIIIDNRNLEIIVVQVYGS